MKPLHLLLAFILLVAFFPWLSTGSLVAQQEPPSAQPGYLGMIADDRQAAPGARVVEVVPEGPADLAGLRRNDRIVSINGQPVRGMPDMSPIIKRSPPGTILRLEVVRPAQDRTEETLTLHLTLGIRPQAERRLFPDFGRIAAHPGELAEEDATRAMLGVRTVPLSAELRARLNVPVTRGAVVAEIVPGSPAATVGIPLESVVIAIDNRTVDSPESLAQQLLEAGPGSTVEVAMFRGTNLIRHMVKLQAPDEPADDRLQLLERRVRELELRVQQLEEALRVRGEG